MSNRRTSLRPAPKTYESLPKTILIGVFEWHLVLMDPELATALDVVGQCSSMDLEIRIRTDIPKGRFAECLAHEIMHACWFVASLTDGADEESVVERLTPVLLQVRRDNPKIFAFIDKTFSSLK